MKTKTKKKLTDLTLADLREETLINQAIVEKAKARLDEVQDELRSRFAQTLASSLVEQDKTHGQHTFEVDGIKITGKVDQTVSWDSAALEKVAATLPWEQVSRTFAIKFSVPEAKFKAISDPKLLDRLIDARTVKLSDPKITFSV